MLSGLISAEDEEEIMKELDELRDQEVIYLPLNPLAVYMVILN
jgi:hypothetical protein